MATLTVNMMDRRAYFWGIQALRTGGLVALGITLFGVNPKPGLHERGLAITITLGVVALAWIGMIVFDIRKWPIAYPLALLSVSGGLLSTLQLGRRSSSRRSRRSRPARTWPRRSRPGSRPPAPCR